MLTATASALAYFALSTALHVITLPTSETVGIPYVASAAAVWRASWLVGHRYAALWRFVRRSNSAIRPPTSVLPAPVGSSIATSVASRCSWNQERSTSAWCDHSASGPVLDCA